MLRLEAGALLEVEAILQRLIVAKDVHLVSDEILFDTCDQLWQDLDFVLGCNCLEVVNLSLCLLPNFDVLMLY